MPNRKKKANAHLLDVQDLCMTFGSGASAKTVVRKISFHIDAGSWANPAPARRRLAAVSSVCISRAPAASGLTAPS